jgi:hypothetical protein
MIRAGRPGNQSSVSGSGRGFSSLQSNVQTSYLLSTKVPSLGSEPPKREAGSHASISAEVKSVWSYIITPPIHVPSTVLN